MRETTTSAEALASGLEEVLCSSVPPGLVTPMLRSHIMGLEAGQTRYYQQVRDAVVADSMPYRINRTRLQDVAAYKQAARRNQWYLEEVLYGGIWGDLLPNERLALEHLYYEDATLVEAHTGLCCAMHRYVAARRQGDGASMSKRLKEALWEVLYHSPFASHQVWERDQATRRRKKQAMLLNSLNIPLVEVTTPEYILGPIRAHYGAMPLEVLLPDIAFPVADVAREMAAEIRAINAEVLQQITAQLGREEKSRISNSSTLREVEDAFVDMTEEIVSGIYNTIGVAIDRQARQGKTAEAITEHIDQTIIHYQDTTIPHKMGMLGLHYHGKLSEVNLRASGDGFYLWISMDDEKVRSSHAVNDGLIFRWDEPPETGHPGHDYNCRCQAAPIQLAAAGRAAIPFIRRWLEKQPDKIKAAVKKVRKRPVVKLHDTKTWPKPPIGQAFKEGVPSRNKPRIRGEKSLYDDQGGEWRYSPEDQYHNPHWDYKPAGRNQGWKNIPINGKPPVK